MSTDLTVEILKEIRDGVLATKDELKHEISGLKLEMSGLKEEMAGTNVRLGRVEQGLNDLGQFMRQIALDQARHERFHAQHVDVLEKDVDDLKARVRRLEGEREQ